MSKSSYFKRSLYASVAIYFALGQVGTVFASNNVNISESSAQAPTEESVSSHDGESTKDSINEADNYIEVDISRNREKDNETSSVDREKAKDGPDVGSSGVNSNVIIVGGLLAAGGGAAALALGGGGSGNDSENDDGPIAKKPEPEPEPSPPVPPPEYGDTPKEFEDGEYHSMSSLNQVNASEAYARKYSGENVVLAIVDTGMDINHSEFAGRVVSPYNGYSNDTDVEDVDGHGTHVAGTVGAARDGEGMHGVAWSAKLMPVSFSDKNGNLRGGPGGNYIKRAWEHAIDNGAKAVNNSWSFEGGHIGTTTREDLQAAISNVIQSGRYFVEHDVLNVFSTGNDSMTQPGSPSGLPYYFEELESHWIAVTAVDENNIVSSYANYCGSAASWCMSAPGNGVYSSVPGGDYGSKSGTSMAAPHVTGAIGVLYQAFPHLSAEEIRSILFETADDIGSSEIYGHGLLNLERATRPIGETRVPVSGNISGKTASMANTSLRVSSAFGDGIEQAFAGKSIMALDDYNRGYHYDLNGLTTLRNQDTKKEALHRLKLFGGIEDRSIQTINSGPLSIVTATRLHSNDPGLGHSAYSRMSLGFTSGDLSLKVSINPDAGRSFGFREAGFGTTALMDAKGFDQPHLSLMENGYGSLIGYHIGSNSDVALGLYSGGLLDDERRSNFQTPSIYGAVGEFSNHYFDGMAIKTSFGALSEKGSMLGSVSEGAFGEKMRSNTFFGSVGAVANLDSKTKVTATASMGHTNFKQNGGLISGGNDLITSSFGVGVLREDFMDEGDSFSLAVTQPLRVESGRINLSLPSTRGMDGSIGYRDVSLSPKPSGREVNLQASYSFNLLDGIDTSIGAMHRFDAGHQKGNHETIGMASISLNF